MRSYEVRHVVAFEETNVVGNVYYANHIRWQGRCRELFLRDHVPDILDELQRGLALVTVRVACDYYAELLPFDEVAIRMSLADLAAYRMSLRFDYYRIGSDTGEELVARGEQELACMRRNGEKMEPEHWPETLRTALLSYSAL
jgi:enediyne biosynthesis thioesterase